MLKDFKPRLYQESILNTAVNHNTLVVLPTGMGKTGVALMTAAQRLSTYPDSKILILAPTKPLVEQIMQVFRKHLDMDKEKITMFTGSVSPEKRQKKFNEAQVIASTPQGLQNDVISNRIDLKDVSLLVFDESHRAVGDYAYVFIAKQYLKKGKHPRMLALTASPGSTKEKIEEVIDNLGIEKIEVRRDTDPDVKPYIQDVDLDWIEVKLPEKFNQLKKYIEDCFRARLEKLKELGYLNSSQVKDMSRTELLKLQGYLSSLLSEGRDFDVMKAVSKVAEAMKIQHALELIESQGVAALFSYLMKINEQSRTTKVKAVKNLVMDINFRSALVLARSLSQQGVEHPKMAQVREIVEGEKGKMIIFTQFRDSADKIVEEINSMEGHSARLFVGQQKKNGKGMSQKEQISMVEEFRQGKFDVLVSTAVGEEGLDIPQVDLVLFYEPVPSAIRTIQRRGRTGRTEKGRMIVLVAKGTRDEAYRWSAHHKEKRMFRNLESLKSTLPYKERPQKKVQSFAPDKPKIFADDREKSSPVIKELIDQETDLNLERLDVADYVLSKRVGVEYKTVQDFVQSIIDGRLLDQIRELSRFFQRPLVIVEGTENIYSVRNVHPHAIQGMLATITVSYGIPILYTRTSRETAMLISTIAGREQEGTDKSFSPHREKRGMTKKEQQEYIVSSLPDIGPSLAPDLLGSFGSVKRVFEASEEELKNLDMMGEKKARKIRELIDSSYKK
ncbi:MAG: DEAD/DEAH box helicase [Nanobdellota archaeon]